MRLRTLSAAAFCFVAAASSLPAALSLPAILSDHMVVQQGQKIRLWGQDEPGTKVSASMAGKTGTAVAGSDGRWSLLLPALPAGGPHDLGIQGSSTLTLHDVLVGEVWLGSGQSNMEFALKATRDRDQELPKAKIATMRLFTVDRATAYSPQKDLRGSWKLCTPESAAEFSAVAYHFGKQLGQHLKVPIGMISSSWGGTPAEDWIPKPALDSEPALAPLLAEWDKDPSLRKLWSEGAPFQVEARKIRFVSKNKKKAPLTLELPATAWGHSEKPGSTGAVKLEQGTLRYSGQIQGGAWATASVDISKAGKDLDLRDYDSLELEWRGTGSYRVTLGQATIKDSDFYATQSMPIPGTWQPVSIPLHALKQGGWGEPKALTLDAIHSINFSVQVPFWPDAAAVAYNGMIAPLTPFAIKGVLWYQGESNVGRAAQYEKTLSLLIRSWRQAWGLGDFPFLIVQLPNFQKGCDQPCESGWAELREAQRLTAINVPAAAMVTTLDQGDPNDIHPKYKTEVARRLSLAALNLGYGKAVVFSGPDNLALRRRGSSLEVTCNHVGRGLLARGGGKLKGFELAGKDGVYHRAEASIDGSKVVVNSAQVPTPVKIRYAWADDPEFNLFNKDGLPASSFQGELKL